LSGRTSPGIPWRRLLVESLAVVLSILLAFSIDAWWDGHKERRRERDVLAGLLEDFEASRAGLEARLGLARRMAHGTTQLLELVDDGAGSTAMAVPDSLILAVLGGPTYEPDTNTLDAAVASGEIDLISNPELRAELATWRRTLADTAEDEREVRRITNEQLVPILARSMSLRTYMDRVLAWSGGDPYGAGRLIGHGDEGPTESKASLQPSTDLVGALAIRKFYVEFAAADLEDLLGSLERSVSMLEGELGRIGPW
jgi:hypothetical protein